MTMDEFYEEQRYDAYMEEKQNARHEKDMFDPTYFENYMEVEKLVDELKVLKKACDEYGHSIYDILGEVI